MQGAEVAGRIFPEQTDLALANLSGALLEIQKINLKNIEDEKLKTKAFADLAELREK